MRKDAGKIVFFATRQALSRPLALPAPSCNDRKYWSKTSARSPMAKNLSGEEEWLGSLRTQNETRAKLFGVRADGLDVVHLSSARRAIFARPEETSEMGKRGRELVTTRCNWGPRRRS
jgi:hypothetical protein